MLPNENDKLSERLVELFPKATPAQIGIFQKKTSGLDYSDVLTAIEEVSIEHDYQTLPMKKLFKLIGRSTYRSDGELFHVYILCHDRQKAYDTANVAVSEEAARLNAIAWLNHNGFDTIQCEILVSSDKYDEYRRKKYKMIPKENQYPLGRRFVRENTEHDDFDEIQSEVSTEAGVATAPASTWLDKVNQRAKELREWKNGQNGYNNRRNVDV